MFRPRIPDNVKYSQFKILCSLFSRKRGRAFDILIFDSKAAKASYDKFFINKGTGYSKRNFGFANPNRLKHPMISSFTSIQNVDNKRKLVLTYFLPLRD